jgi:beta-glucanase (GH16 family)
MIRPFVALLTLIAASSASAQAPSPDVPAGYHLLWSDEFAREGLPDPSKWRFDTHANKGGWYNKELQYYASERPENARIENGRLIITARREALSAAPDYGGQRYTSARLITQGKATWTYGFFEIRAKLPCGAGSWPAIWMLGAEAGWPDGGEIDILEHVGHQPGIVHSTVHTRASAGTHGSGNSLALPTACSAFHRYQLEWTPEALRFSVDGVPVHSYSRAGREAAAWPFDKPQYLLLNLAIGGEWGGKVDDGIFPATFEIDYVRIYQKAGLGPSSSERASGERG